MVRDRIIQVLYVIWAFVALFFYTHLYVLPKILKLLSRYG